MKTGTKENGSRLPLPAALLLCCLAMHPAAALADGGGMDAAMQGGAELSAPVMAPPPKPHQRQETRLILEGRAAGLAFANQGADLAAGFGMQSAMDRAAGPDGAGGFTPFAAVSGAHQRVDNGSRIHVTGASAMFGMAWTAGMEQAKLMGGAFLEFGAARMTARLKISDFYDRNRFHGRGDASCAGGGLMLRADLTGTKLSGLYAEASFRAGSMDSVWRSDDLSAVWNGRLVRYDISTPYYGAHAGLGYVLRLSETWSIDFSGKYLWTHLDGRSTHVAGDPYLFKSVDSHRLRFGVRAEAKLSGRSVAYAGAAWEREFDGDAGATAFGFDTPSTSIRGDTGTLGLGVSFSPSSLPDLRLEIGGSAFTGKRRGVSGTFLLTYAF